MPNIPTGRYAWFRHCDEGDTHVFQRPASVDAKTWRNRISVNKCHAVKASPGRAFSLRTLPDGSILATRMREGEIVLRGRPFKDGQRRMSKSAKRLQLLQEQRARERALAELALGKDRFDLSAEATPEVEAVRARSRFQLKDTAGRIVQDFQDVHPDWFGENRVAGLAPYRFFHRKLFLKEYGAIHPNQRIALLALVHVIGSKLVRYDGERIPVSYELVPVTHFGRPFDVAVLMIGAKPADVDLKAVV